MNIVDGLALFMARKKIKGKELARILECSDSKGDLDSLKIVVDGLRKILEALDNQMTKNLDEPRKT